MKCQRPVAEEAKVALISHQFGIWKFRGKQNCGQHAAVLKNFTNAIAKGEDLVAHGSEGIHSVELGNAMLYSGLNKVDVELPLDHEAYEAMLKKLIAESRFEKKEAVAVASNDMGGSF